MKFEDKPTEKEPGIGAGKLPDPMEGVKSGAEISSGDSQEGERTSESSIELSDEQIGVIVGKIIEVLVKNGFVGEAKDNTGRTLSPERERAIDKDEAAFNRRFSDIVLDKIGRIMNGKESESTLDRAFRMQKKMDEVQRDAASFVDERLKRSKESIEDARRRAAELRK